MARPLILVFPPRVDEQPYQELTMVEMQDQFRQDWMDARLGFQHDISLRDYIDLRMRHTPNKGNREHHNDLRRKVGKLSLILTSPVRFQREHGFKWWTHTSI